MKFYEDENYNNTNKKPTNLQGLGGGRRMEMMKVGGGGNKRRALGLLVNQFNHNNNNNLPPGGRGGGLINKRSSSHPQPLPRHQTHHHTTLQVQVEVQVQVQVQFQEESKKQKPSVPRPNTFGECIFIDADDTYLPDHDQPVPMLLEQHTEEDSSIIIHDTDHHHPHHTEEIEMEEGSVVDIDEFDAKNPLAVVDYVADIYTYYKKMESLSCVSPDYMARQTDINEKMRAILIDWLIEVHDKFELLKETLFLTVTLIDRFLSQQPMARKKLQLVGLVAMLLACKYEEVSVPIVGDLIVISDKAYTRKEVLEMEKLMLNKLQFNLSLPTPYVFMTRFLKAAQSDTKLEMLAFYLVELSLVEYEMLHFTPSLLAASAIYTAQCSLYGFKQWTRTCEWHTTYSEHQLLECSRKMVGFHQQAGTGKLTGVYRKYNSSKLGYTSSKYEPAGFLLETQL